MKRVLKLYREETNLAGSFSGAITILLCLLLVWDNQVAQPEQVLRCDHQPSRDGSLALGHNRAATLGKLEL